MIMYNYAQIFSDLSPLLLENQKTYGEFPVQYIDLNLIEYRFIYNHDGNSATIGVYPCLTFHGMWFMYTFPKRMSGEYGY